MYLIDGWTDRQMHKTSNTAYLYGHVYVQAYKHDSTNISVIEWLGAYYIESQFCEKAVPYFERATVIQSVVLHILSLHYYYYCYYY